MYNRLRQLGRDSLVYGVGGIAARAIGLIVLPVYTRVLKPAEYGDIEILAISGAFFGALLSMGMDSAQSFYFYEQKEGGHEARKRVISAIAQWRLTWGVALVVAGTALSPLLNRFLFDSRLDWRYFMVIFVVTLLDQQASQAADVFRLEHQPWRYMSITMTNTMLTALAAIFFVAVLNLGVLGFLIGSAVGSLLAAVVGSWGIRSYLDFSTSHRDWWPRILRFGIPFVPASLAMYVLSSSDRWFISYFHGQDALGVFAVGARFATLISAAVIVFRQAWWPVAMESLHHSDGPELMRFMARAYLGLMAIGVVLLTALSPWLVKILTGPAYHSAYPIVGVLAWPAVLYGFYLIVAAGMWKREKTAWLPVAMGIAAVVNVALSLALVPRFAAMGAAIATAVSFVVWIAVTTVVSERLWKIGHSFVALSGQLVAGAGATAAILVLFRQQRPAWMVVAVTIVASLVIAAISVDRPRIQAMVAALRRRAERPA